MILSILSLYAGYAGYKRYRVSDFAKLVGMIVEAVPQVARKTRRNS